MQRVGGWMAAALCLTACGASGGKTLTLGAIFSMNDTLANIGSAQVRAAELAIEEINGKGGVLDARLALLTKDDASDSARGKAAAADLIAAGVPAIFGAIASQITLDISTVTIPAGIVQISGAATSPALTTVVDDGFLWRTCASDSLQGKLLAGRARKKGFTKVAILHLPGAYGDGLSQTFAASFTAAGGTVTKNLQYVERQSSYSALLAELFADPPEAILLIAYPTDGAQIIHDYTTGFAARGVFWFFTDALEDTGFLDAVGASNFTFSHEGTGVGTPTGPHYDAYLAAYKSRWGTDSRPGTFAANVYDAVYLVALAIQAAGKSDGPSIRDALQAVSAGGTAYGPLDYAAAAAAARAGGDVDFEGASGPVDLDAQGDVVAPYDIWKVSNGDLITVEQSINP
jgi:branched-chain amino acid transport system substrate-binding protein